MPNPNSSGTGFLDVSSWLQLFGEDEGWAYMDGLHENIAAYTHSGSKPCKQAAAGEVPIGVSFAFRAAQSEGGGRADRIVIPEEGIGWDMEATAIVKGTDKLDAAKTLVDWSVSEKANKMYNKGYAVIAVPEPRPAGDELPGEHREEDDRQRLRLGGAATATRILAEWQKRYDSKSEPKS